jgi:hypothetical protein
MLQSELRPAGLHEMTKKIIGRCSYLFILHNNAQPHTATQNRETILELKSEVLNFQAYSPDLAPSDFYLFWSLKGAFRGHQFADDDDKVKEALHDWLCTQPKQFYSDGVRKLVDCWTKCIKMQRDYIE